MDLVKDEATLRALAGGEPAERSIRKQLDHLDEHARRFLAAAPFYLLATADEDGACDATPRGDDPGIALVLDEKTLALPERPGNRRLDSLTNILRNPRIGLLFVVPGSLHSLRVNGTARIVSDAPFFDRMTVYGKRPILALVVDVSEVYFHCGKAFVRSRLWQPESWPEPGEVATLGRVLASQLGLPEAEGVAADARSSMDNRPNLF